jgi:hypothetical protein
MSSFALSGSVTASESTSTLSAKNDARYTPKGSDQAAAFRFSSSPNPGLCVRAGRAFATTTAAVSADALGASVPRPGDSRRAPDHAARRAGRVDDLGDAAVLTRCACSRSPHRPLTDEQRARHLQLNCELYRQAGHDLLVPAQTLETDADVAQLLAAVGADEVFTVRLEAARRTLVERITEREPAGWSGLASRVEHTQELAVTMPALAGVDLVLSTEGAHPEDVAARIRAACPTQLTAPATSER